MNLEDIVDQGHQLPLGVDLDATAQGETSQAEGLAQVTEHRLDDSQALSVDGPAQRRVDLLAHTLQRTALLILSFLQQDIDLASPFLPGVAQALITQFAGGAVALMPHELHEDATADLGTGAFEPETFAGRADAGLLLRVRAKILGAEPTLGCFLWAC